jgi:hypothetical protein
MVCCNLGALGCKSDMSDSRALLQRVKECVRGGVGCGGCAAGIGVGCATIVC